MSQRKTDDDKTVTTGGFESDEKAGFYIGWQPEAPPAFSRHIKKTIIALATLFSIISITLAIFQKKFGTASFEFGKLTEIKGIYFNTPVPNIKVIEGKDIFGNLNYLTVPLVGYGKHGAYGIISDIEKKKNILLHGKQVTMKGTLLYNDGKTLMQVDANDEPILTIGAQTDASLFPVRKELGIQTIKGEIIDPKCYFGVMKPGEGKPHKDCAIRCILGGIPPVFHVMNEKGESNYYLIVGPKGEKMNEVVKNHVAEPVTIRARVVQSDDWIVIHVEDTKDIQPYSYIQTHLAGQALSCVVDCIK
jgi:hypothetical protein